MGFPTSYTDLSLPTLLVHILTILDLIRRLFRTILSLTGLDFLLEPEPMPLRPSTTAPASRSVGAALIRELLPVVRYDEVSHACRPESCAVCLCEYEDDDEIRRLANCPHVFHRTCVDRWIDHDQKTCPLCRTSFVPQDILQESFDEQLWAASEITDFAGELSAISVPA